MTPTFYSAPQSSSNSNPQVRKENFQAAIKPLLQPNSFTGAGAVSTLVTLITDFGSQDVGAQQRLEILTKIRDNAGNHYFRAWSENMTAIDITREWLKAGATAKSDSPLVETIMPLLHVSNAWYFFNYSNHPFIYLSLQIIDRLPLSVDTLKSSKLGKIVLKLTKDPPAPGEFF